MLIFFCSHCRARRAIIVIRSSREFVQILYRVQRALILPLTLTSFSLPAAKVALIVAPLRSSLLSRRRGRVLNSLSRCRGRGSLYHRAVEVACSSLLSRRLRSRAQVYCRAVEVACSVDCRAVEVARSIHCRAVEGARSVSSRAMRSRDLFQIAPSRSRDLFQVALSRARTPLIAAPSSRPRTPLRRPQRAHLRIAPLCAQLHAPSRRSNSILIAPLCTQASSRRRALTLHCAAMRSTFIGPFYLMHVVRLASNFSAHSI